MKIIIISFLLMLVFNSCHKESRIERLEFNELFKISSQTSVELPNGNMNVSMSQWRYVYYPRFSQGVCMKDIQINKSFKSKAIVDIEEESETNAGTLSIANLKMLRIFHRWYDNATYKNGSLDVDFIDINGDGSRDIVVSGLVYYTDDTHQVILQYEPVIFIYLFRFYP